MRLLVLDRKTKIRAWKGFRYPLPASLHLVHLRPVSQCIPGTGQETDSDFFGMQKPAVDRIERLFSELKNQLDSCDETYAAESLAVGIKNSAEFSYLPDIANHEFICPFLRTIWDDTIVYGYPEDENYCHRAGKPRPISLDHQQQVCISSQFKQCSLSIPVPATGGGNLRSFLQRLFQRG